MSMATSDRHALRLFVATNLCYISMYLLGFNFIGIICNLLSTAILLGGLCRPLVGLKSEDCDGEGETERYEFVKAEDVAKLLESVYMGVNYVCSEFRAIVLWKRPTRTVNAWVVLCVVSRLVRIMRTDQLLFMVVWLIGASVYLKDEYYNMIHPHVKPIHDKVVNEVHRLYSAIPRFKESQKL